MSDLKVTDITVPELLESLQKREWLIPKFQRDFVWSISDVIELLISIFEARPIGMATLWEQTEPTELDLVPVFVLDYDPEGKCTKQRFFSSLAKNPPKMYAILDGRQRCTALAMAFGGLRAHHGRYKYAGRYFLDVTAEDDSRRFVFKKEGDIKRDKLSTDANCISRGLFPLTSNQEGEEILGQWMRYLQSIRTPSFYEDGKLPAPEVLDRRDRILKQAFEGIVGTKLAVYIVPDSYHLKDICEIFEKLNQTGTIVSTVDLIHSWLYADTATDPEGAIELRDRISDLGQKDGAIGWASATDRPELVAQIVTACYVALEGEKPEPRKVSGSKLPNVSSLKAGDLLATPTLHWKNLLHNDALLAEFLGDFQKVVAGAYFPYSACPYPATSAIYVALRWHGHFDFPNGRPWGRTDLDSVFRAFFWRNALSNRYDQGFLTQVGADIKQFKQWLSMHSKYQSVTEWAADVQKDMDAFMEKKLPLEADLFEVVTDGRPQGALLKATTLPMVTGVTKDLLDPKMSLAYPGNEVEMHHIFPKSWCANSKSHELAELLNPDKAGRDWIDSIANLMPLSRKSNNLWKAKIPGQALLERKVTYDQVQEILRPAFIDETAFDYLLRGTKNIKEFWERRAKLIVGDLIRRTSVVV
jgi:Protein of unknown function DUF262